MKKYFSKGKHIFPKCVDYYKGRGRGWKFITFISRYFDGFPKFAGLIQFRLNFRVKIVFRDDIFVNSLSNPSAYNHIKYITDWIQLLIKKFVSLFSFVKYLTLSHYYDNISRMALLVTLFLVLINIFNSVRYEK